jgi:hypothetical protein
MPIRTATLNRQIHKNGVQLHRAMARRLQSDGSETPVSAKEQALLDERQHLKEERTHRHELAASPRPKPAALAREPKPAKPPKEKAPKAAKEPKAAKDKGDKGAKAKDHKPSRAEKQAKKAEALAAARRSPKAAKH